MVDRNQHILNFFKQAIDSERLAHGYLFWGPDGSGKKDTAFWLADFLKTNDFDILYIISEEGKKSIAIDQIRRAKKHLSLSSYNSAYKFVIIDGAEAMKTDAANALLKTLEEPQGNTVLILTTTKPDFLPNTIISRLQNIRFGAVSLDKISEKFLNKEHINLLKKPLNDIFKYIEKIHKEETETFSLLNSWLFWFRDKMIEDNKYSEKLKQVLKTKDLISSTNTNKRLALENLVLEIK